MSHSTSNLPSFSVLLPTYAGDQPEHLDTAIRSLAKQSLVPDEVLVVADGPLTRELESTLQTWKSEFPTSLVLLQLEENRGLGAALRAGVEACEHELVARMDADDFSVPDRFERQLSFLSEHPDVDVVGGYIGEFSDSIDDIETVRVVPESHETIQRTARFRSPMNHASVVFRRHAVLDVGNYKPVDRMEDYDLWVRMLLDGFTFANVPVTLLKVRAGKEMFQRRGGVEYAREELKMQRRFLRYGFTNLPIFVLNLLTRVPIRFVPNIVRGRAYEHLFRSRP
jgi:glycosyltransferase involved in cell wall biosynthesis